MASATAGARDDGRPALVDDGRRDQRRNAEQPDHDHACRRVEHAEQDQPQGRRSHCDVPGRQARPRCHADPPAGTSSFNVLPPFTELPTRSRMCRGELTGRGEGRLVAAGSEGPGRPRAYHAP
jgi:hypothetical protein